MAAHRTPRAHCYLTDLCTQQPRSKIRQIHRTAASPSASQMGKLNTGPGRAGACRVTLSGTRGLGSVTRQDLGPGRIPGDCNTRMPSKAMGKRSNVTSCCVRLDSAAAVSSRIIKDHQGFHTFHTIHTFHKFLTFDTFTSNRENLTKVFFAEFLFFAQNFKMLIRRGRMRFALD